MIHMFNITTLRCPKIRTLRVFKGQLVVISSSIFDNLACDIGTGTLAIESEPSQVVAQRLVHPKTTYHDHVTDFVEKIVVTRQCVHTSRLKGLNSQIRG